MGIGKFSNLRGNTRNSGIHVGETSFDLNDGNVEGKNENIDVNNGIGKHHDPKPYYKRQSEIKSEGGYNVSEETKGE